MAERISRHAEERAAQRNIHGEDFDLILRYGTTVQAAGAVFYFLGHRHIPEELRSDDRIARLEGTVLVVSDDNGTVITAYRNKRGFRAIKKKLKRYAPKKMAA